MSTPSAPGRKAIGIDFGGTSVKIGLCQEEKLIERGKPIPTEAHDTVDSLIDAMVRGAKELMDGHESVEAVGVGVPGFVDFESGFLHALTNVRGWVNVPLKHILEDRLQLPVTVENDANAMAYAEWKYGAAKGLRNVICLTLGTGVGGGLILNHELFRGSCYGAGEIGQISIAYDGTPGNYGNLGALEKYVGNQQIEQHAIECYARVNIAKKRGECTPEVIAAAAKAGDDIAREIWADVAVWLGTGLSTIVWLLNPDAVVVGGGIAKAGDLLFDPLRIKMQSMLNPVFWERLQLVPAQFGNEAGTIGCAALALDECSKATKKKKKP